MTRNSLKTFSVLLREGLKGSQHFLSLLSMIGCSRQKSQISGLGAWFVGALLVGCTAARCRPRFRKT